MKFMTIGLLLNFYCKIISDIHTLNLSTSSVEIRTHWEYYVIPWLILNKITLCKIFLDYSHPNIQMPKMQIVTKLCISIRKVSNKNPTIYFVEPAVQ